MSSKKSLFRLPVLSSLAKDKPLSAMWTSVSRTAEGDYGLPLASMGETLARARGVFSKKRKEADSATSALGATTRAGVNKLDIVSRETFWRGVDRLRGTGARFRESARMLEQDELPTRFKVVLLQEGMGNFGSRFYYTTEALQSGVLLFEGKKSMANHPSETEEVDRPEREIENVAGYYTNLSVEFSEMERRHELVGFLEFVNDDSTRWIRARFMKALEYAKKYPGKSFIGLSINASGDHEPVPIDVLIKSGKVPSGALLKLEDALKMGINEVNVVTQLTNAQSCDIVTDAGAGGRVLSVA